MLTPIKQLNNAAVTWIDHLQSPLLLAARLYIAWVFFKSGLTKLNDWESTLLLFEYEYAVPVLDHVTAAYMATAGELVLPVLLALGLFGRFSAVGLFIVNWIAVISLEDMPAAALNLHYIWAMASALVIFWGAGFFSADKWLGFK
ncbi:MAG: DoxX family protein [Kangiellaceae bacterium]|jgi:putative oxidoreductase|nr:DoxX family protein [Kangiellaceae bacterium]